MKRFAVLTALGLTVAVLLVIFAQEINSEERKPTPSRVTEEKRKANILSFDGGGSKGIMEVAILDDVMRLVTILKDNPTSLEYLKSELLRDQIKRKALIDDLSKVTDPIHPTKIFDMIVGTSTGGLIAFGLVGGNTDYNGKRLPMSLRECMEMYLNNTGKIFEKSWLHWLVSSISSIFTKIPFIAHSQDNLKKVLSDQFGDSSLADFRDSENVAAVVARKIGQKEELVLFDTKSDGHKLHKVKQVLLATANAPVYFETPVEIGREEYVDGGVGGNCPLAQAIPRAQEIFGDVNFVLSVAPPSPHIEKQIPSFFQLKYWLTYFVHQSTDGYAVYKDVKRGHKLVSFRRFIPRGESLKDFELDEGNAQHMLDAIEDEKLTNSLFLVDVIAMATFVLNAYVSNEEDSTEETIEVGAKLASLAGRIYAAELNYGMATDSFEISLHLWRKITDDRVKKSIAETEGYFSENLIRQGRYREGSNHAILSLKNWQAFYNDEDHVNVSYALFTYGKSQHLSGEYKEGYKNYKLALEMQRRIYGENASNAYIATTLVHMAWLCREHGELEKAESYLTNALHIRRQLYGGDSHIDVARTLDGLGLCSTAQGNFKEGEQYLQDSLKIKKRLFGNKNHPAIAASYNNLGWCLIRQQRQKEAQDNLRLALQMKQALYGEDDHKSIALTLENLARSLVYQGQLNSALEHAQQALVMKRKCLGDIESPIIAKTLYTIGLCFVKKKSFLEAHEYITEAINIVEVVFESKVHPVLAIYFTTLGDSLVGMGNDSEAKGHFENALKLIDDHFGGEHHPDVPNLLRKLVDVSKQLNHKDDEVEYRRRLQRIQQRMTKVFSYRIFGTQPLVDEEICPQTKCTRSVFLGFESSDAELPPNESEPSHPTRTEL